MIANVELFLFWLIFAVSSYWLTVSLLPRVRGIVLLIVCYLFIAAVAPVAALIAAYIAATVIVWLHIFSRTGRSVLIWVAVGSVILPLLLFRLYAKFDLPVTLGIGFLTLKALATLIDGYQNRQRPAVLAVLLQTYFVPSYSAGPVQPLASFHADQLETSISIDRCVKSIGRIALGFFKSLFIADIVVLGLLDRSWLDSNDAASGMTRSDGFLVVALSFAYTYINFSAYMDIAIGSGRLLGIRLMENFNYPFLARSLSDFWRRWHISLGQWAMKYVYFPLIVRFTHPVIPYVSVILTFTLIGLWHEFTINYFLWGLGHGTGLAFVQFVRMRMRKVKLSKSAILTPMLAVSTTALTLFYVALLQTIANLDGFDVILRLLGTLTFGVA